MDQSKDRPKLSGVGPGAYASAMSEVPPALVRASNLWSNAGNPPQTSFAWNPSAWRSRLKRSASGTLADVDLVKAVDAIEEKSAEIHAKGGSQIDRVTVTQLSTPGHLNAGEANAQRQAVVTAFIAAMIWGYGTAGYGPYRTERVLREDPEVIDHLLEVARISNEGGAAAFEHIAKKRRGRSPYLKYLGPAFGTKFLYFLTAGVEDVEPAPVMDALVRRWFRDNTNEQLITAWWDTESYRNYIGHLDNWAAELGRLRRDDVEHLIFTDARGIPGNVWPGTTPPDPEALPVEMLLDLLSDEAAALHGTRGNHGSELVEELGAWFSAAPDSSSA